MPAIFLSHSSADCDCAIASTVKRALEDMGFASVFLDFDAATGLHGGAQWEQELYVNLRKAAAVVPLLSEHFAQSKWCFAEVVTARQMGKCIVPLTLGNGTLMREFQDTQVISYEQDRLDGFPRLRRALERVGLIGANDFVPHPARSPYPGLMYFDEKDAAVYTGRESDIAHALDRIQAIARFRRRELVLIAGASGAGKSSLLRAGIIPRLRKDQNRWHIRGPIWPSDGLGALRQLVEEPLPSGDAVLVCCIDQLEEALENNLGQDWLRFLADSVSGARRTLFIATIRSDFLGAFQTAEPIRDLDIELLSLGLLMRSRFPEIIERPAFLYGVQFEPGLVQRIVTETGQAEALPLLAFVLRRLWEENASNRLIDSGAYEAVGGIDGAVAAAARSTGFYSSSGAVTSVPLSNIFAQLVEFGDSGQMIRRKALPSDFPTGAEPVLNQLIKARLLSTGEHGGTVEVVHEALFQIWPEFAAWIEKERVFLLWRRRLHARMAEYAAIRNEDYLPHGEVLSEAVRFVAAHREHLSAAELEFVEASELAAAQKRKNQELETWRTQFEMRFQQWKASGRSRNFLLSGPFLATARMRMAEKPGFFSEEARSFIALSGDCERKLEARRHARSVILKWSPRVVASCLLIAAVGAAGRAAGRAVWIRSDAYILSLIRKDVRERLTSSSAWFRLAIATGLAPQAAKAVDELPPEDRSRYLAIMSKQGVLGDPAKLREKGLADANRGCEALTLESFGKWVNPFRFESLTAIKLECLVRNAAAAEEAGDGALADSIRALARGLWQDTKGKASSTELSNERVLIFFAHEVGMDAAALDIWNDKVAPTIRAGLKDSDNYCLGAWMPPGIESRRTLELLRPFPRSVFSSSIAWCFVRGFVKIGKDKAAVELLERINVHDLASMGKAAFSGDNSALLYQQPLIWKPETLIAIDRVVDRRLISNGDAEDKGTWRHWIRNQLGESGSVEGVQSIPVQIGESSSALSRALLAKGDYDQALSTAANSAQAALAIALMVDRGAIDQALSAIENDKRLETVERSALRAIAGDALLVRGRSSDASRLLDASEQWFRKEVLPVNWSGGSEYAWRSRLWVRSASSFARAGRLEIAYYLAHKTTALTGADADTADALSTILGTATRWHQRIGLFF